MLIRQCLMNEKTRLWLIVVMSWFSRPMEIYVNNESKREGITGRQY